MWRDISVCQVILLTILLRDCICEDSNDNDTLTVIIRTLKTFKKDIKAAENAEKEAKDLWKKAEKDLFVDIVKASAKYTVQKEAHRKHVIEADNGNEKRLECIEKTMARVPDFDTKYLDSEQECITKVKILMQREKKKMRNLVKAIDKWLKSLKYAAGVCVKRYPETLPDAKTCLRRYVADNNYDEVLYKHIKALDAMQRALLNQLSRTQDYLDQCLAMVLLNYLEDLRNFRRNVDICSGTSESDAIFLPLQNSDILAPEQLLRRKGKLKCAP